MFDSKKKKKEHVDIMKKKRRI